MKESIAHNNRLINNYYPADYADTFSQEIICNQAITPKEFHNLAFNQLPKWIEWLMCLRNVVVKPLGLATNIIFADMICEKSPNEEIFGRQDKHLSFYVSLWCGNFHGNRQVLRITTIVKYNNILGRVYFFFIKFFHYVIIRSLLNHIKKRLYNKNNSY